MRTASLVLLAALTVGCATARPVVVPQPVEVIKPVPVPCPVPPPLPQLTLAVPELCDDAATNEVLLAMVRDYLALAQRVEDLNTILDAYRKQ